jgi:MFS family permease
MFTRFIKHYLSSFQGLPKKAWLLAVIMLINRSGSMVLFFLTLYFNQKLGFNISETGKLMSIYGLGSLIGTFTGGLLTDKWGSKRVQLVSLFLGGIGYIILGQLSNIYSIAFMLLILAIIVDAFRPANLTAMAEACPQDQQARGFALNRLAMSLGLAIGPAIGGYLAMIKYDYLFWTDGFTCILASILFLIFFFNDKKHSLNKHQKEEIRYTSPWNDGLFLCVMGLLFMTGVIFFQIFNTWPLYLKEHITIAENQIGMLFTLNCIMIAIMELPLVHRLGNTNPLRIMAVGSLFICGGFFLLPYGTSYWYVIFTVFIWTIGEMLTFPLAMTFVSKRAMESNRGKYMGFFTFTFSCSFAIGPAAGSWIYYNFSPFSLWMITGIMGLFVFAGFQVIYYKMIKSNTALEF